MRVRVCVCECKFVCINLAHITHNIYIYRPIPSKKCLMVCRFDHVDYKGLFFAAFLY